MSVKRYRPEPYDYRYGGPEMGLDSEGDYVRYEDYERLSRENEVLREQNFAMNKTCVELEKKLEWQPLETAPREGQVVFFCDAGGNRWTDCAPSDWRLNGCGRPPVFWMPLPEPPK